MSNNYFFFLSLNSIFFLRWKCVTSPLETGSFSPIAISWVFLVHWIKRRHDFFMRKPFLGFLLYFFISYVAISVFCLRGKSFNENRNHHQYIIGTALMQCTGLLVANAHMHHPTPTVLCTVTVLHLLPRTFPSRPPTRFAIHASRAPASTNNDKEDHWRLADARAALLVVTSPLAAGRPARLHVDAVPGTGRLPCAPVPPATDAHGARDDGVGSLCVVLVPGRGHA